MITILVLTTIAAAFVIGFLLGDRRGVKQCNTILDENWRELMKSIREDNSGFPSDPDHEEETAQPTVH